MKLKNLAVAALITALGFGSQPAFAQQAVVVDRAAVANDMLAGGAQTFPCDIPPLTSLVSRG